MDGSQSQRYLRDAKAKMRAEEAQFAQRLRQGRKHQLSVAAARISQMNGWAEQLKDDRRFDMKVESNGSDSDDSDSGRTYRAIESSTGQRPILAIGAQRAHVIIKAPDRHPIKIKLGPQFDKEYMAMRDAISKLEQRRRASGGSKSSQPGGVILIDGLRLPRSTSKQDDSGISSETSPRLGPGSHDYGHGQSAVSGGASSRSPGRAGDGTGAAGSNATQVTEGGEQLGKQGTLRQMRHVLREVATLTQVLREQASVLRSRGWNGASRGDLQVQRQLPWRPPSSGHGEGKAAGDVGEGGSRASASGAVGGAWSGSDGGGTGEGCGPLGSRTGGGAGGTPWTGGRRGLGHFPAQGAAQGSAEGGRSADESEAGSQARSLRSKASAAHGSAGGPPPVGMARRLLVEAGHEIGSHPDPLPQEVAKGAGLRSDGEVTAAVGGYRATPELLGQIRSTLRSAAEQSRDAEL